MMEISHVFLVGYTIIWYYSGGYLGKRQYPGGIKSYSMTRFDQAYTDIQFTSSISQVLYTLPPD